MKKSVVISLALLLGFLMSSSFADEVTVFGPKQYVRTKGKPNVYTDSFSATAGQGKLIVKNGEEDGSHRLSSAVIFLNRQRIFGPRDFNRHVYRLEAPVDLVEDNSLTVILSNGKKIFGPRDFNRHVYRLEAPVDLVEDNLRAVKVKSKPWSYLTIEVTQGAEPPTVIISADPGTILLGESSALSWTSTNADTSVIEPDIGAVDPSGSTTVSPTETTTYTITATGPGGTATASVTVTVTYLEPTVSISASPETITLGESSTLSWTSTNANSATIDQGIGDVPVSGSTTVSPAVTTTYTIAVTGPGGTATDSITVNVTIPTPTVSISANPKTIILGESSALSWSSTYADSAAIDQGIGDVPVSGSTTVSPARTTTYTITVTGPGGTATDQATVTVRADVEPQPEGSFGEQYEDLIPPDATLESYDPKRFSVITGLVKDLNGLPIADVAITILDHLEYGTAMTDDAEGRFSFPVEGGGTVTVVYQKQGLLTVHRKVYVPWNDIAIAETIEMIPEDPASTTLTFDGDPGTIVTHESTELTDEFGTRSCTAVFTGDNHAYEVDADGNIIQKLTTITARATEFTTPDSMPAKLPPTSMYTYCVELRVDGAERVKFENPVITWVDNFVGFDVGMAVPVGSYDRDRGVWVPEENGMVVKLLDTDIDGITDALDATGDDQPDDLNNNGSFSDEVTGLGDPGRYPPGSTFWRFAATHFTPWDANWPFGPPPDAISPNPSSGPSTDVEDKPCRKTPTSSYVKHMSRSFHEDIPIPGTDITLHYASNRVEGYHPVITVPASGDTVPSSLKRIFVQLAVAGLVFQQNLDPLPNQKTEFVWDGLDHLGRPVMGTVIAHVAIGFVYDAVYLTGGDYLRAFAQAGRLWTGILARKEVIFWLHVDFTIPFTIPKGAGTIAEGWTLSNHHHLSPPDFLILHKGDGTIVDNAITKAIDTVAGDGTLGFSGDGGPATEAQLNWPWDVALDASGSLYIADTWNWRIRKVDTNGIITTVAGSERGYDGDDGPATEAQLDVPASVVLDASGNLYIADNWNNCIRKVDTSGIITTLAGNGTSGFSGDGGPATMAQFNSPLGVAVDVSGNLYIADSTNHRIRKVDTNGIITTVAGSGEWGGYDGDGGPATEARLYYPRDVVLDASGNLYIADSNNHRIRKVDPSGIITTVAGFGEWGGYGGDGGPATEAALNLPSHVALDAAGNLYIVDVNNYRIRKIDTYGIITTVAGNGLSGYGGDGGPATKAQFNIPSGVALDASGNLYIAGNRNNRIRRVSPPSPFAGYTAAEDITFTEEEGLGHVLSTAGRHKWTIDLDTGVVLHEFGYNENKQLISIIDQFGNQTTIERDGSGLPTAITSPDGITTALTIDADNHIIRITYPDGNFYGFEYTSDGLMTAKVEPEGNRFEHTFNSVGRVTDATDQEGGHWQFSRSAYESGDILTEVLSAEGDLTSYFDHYASTGAYSSTITDPTGAEIFYTQSDDALSVTKSLPCGMELAFKLDIDSEYKFRYVKQMTESAPSGLERIISRNKTYQDTNADDTPDLITDQVTLNGRAITLVTNTLQSTRTLTSPTGRSVMAQYDPATLLTTALSIPGLFDTNYGYDARGRLTSISTNTRETTFSYNAQGFLESITDPENHTTSYSYDAVGRMTDISRPDSSSLGFTYDQNGNMTVLTNPSSIDHGFGYNSVNLNTSYQTPLSGTYSYFYDRDRRLIGIDFPSGRQISLIYDRGRPVQIQTPEGNIDLTYYCGPMVESVTKGTEAVTYGFDGKLVTSETLTGTLNQVLGYTYNNDFNFTRFTYAGNTVNYTYDNDGLLTGAGNFTITRNAQNGLPGAVAGGALNLSRSFNGYGELDSEAFAVNNQDINSWSLVRGDTGRIMEKTETVDGVTSHYIYTYDSMGRVRTVTQDGALVEEYHYNQNGTRIYGMNSLRGISGRNFTYSDEDHLLTAGDTSYQYDVDGFLVNKTDGSEVTEYVYSSRGELLRVTLPDGRVIEYIYDPLGRRIAKMVNGAIVEKYLWQEFTKILAVYDRSDNLLMRFEYADARTPVAMTKDGITYYLTYDQVGSLRVVSDSSGNVIKRIDYDSFGNIINDSDPTFEIPFGFAGGLHDRDTGIVRFGYRDYDPDIGRWTAKDPVGFWGGDTDLYGYCLSDPINWVDSIGLWAKLVLDRSTGFLTAIDDDGNLLIIPIKEGGISSTPDDPYGRDGPLPPGHYNVNPRPENLNHPCRPTISTPGQDWNTVVTPMGTVRYGIQIHPELPGIRSRGCLLTRPGTNDYNELLRLINDEYNDGGVTLDVLDSTSWLWG